MSPPVALIVAATIVSCGRTSPLPVCLQCRQYSGFWAVWHSADVAATAMALRRLV